MHNVHFHELSQIQKQLVLAAAESMKTSYSPYSGFPVGAALLTKKGEIITASNYENASYGCTVCAETAAVVRANAMGERRLEAVAVVGGLKDDVIYPCGNCRQVLSEASQLSGKDIEVILSDGKRSNVVLTTVSELLPSAFGPSDLQKK
jgi:cytidine deaminase